ncbi:hypothetical protein [Streptomyces chrestomyceticus]|uniref:hypothetical protein n=1 Tax=Streptomyces chrestomyceticus TaxID=68185 RepID=UPI003405564C
MLLKFALHSLMDLVLWTGGKGLDRARSARKTAAFRRGETVTLRCRFRIRAQGPAMHRGSITLNRSGVFLDGPGAKGRRLSAPAASATGGGRGGTAVDCTVTTKDGVTKQLELLLPTWDKELLKLITETMPAQA